MIIITRAAALLATKAADACGCAVGDWATAHVLGDGTRRAVNDVYGSNFSSFRQTLPMVLRERPNLTFDT